jgi:hypothetical protein
VVAEPFELGDGSAASVVRVVAGEEVVAAEVVVGRFRSRLPAGAGRWRWMRLGACVSPVDVVPPWFGRDRVLD